GIERRFTPLHARIVQGEYIEKTGVGTGNCGRDEIAEIERLPGLVAEHLTEFRQALKWATQYLWPVNIVPRQHGSCSAGDDVPLSLECVQVCVVGRCVKILCVIKERIRRPRYGKASP